MGDDLNSNKGGEDAARGYYLIGCNRIIDSLVASAARMVEICADLDKIPQQAQAGIPIDVHVMKAENDELAELKDRVESCVNINNTYDIHNGNESGRYDREMCRLEAISADVGRHGAAVGLDSIVGTACDDIQFSRQMAAQDAQFRGQLAGILASGAQGITSAVAHGQAQVEAARHGQVLPDSQAASGSGPSSGVSPASCLDSGQSCQTDQGAVHWKGLCSANPPNQAPCYCAAVATYSCFIAHGCYAEAGAKQPNGQPSTTTLASLQQGAASNSSSAQALGTTCTATASCVPSGGTCTDGIQCCSHACAGQGTGNKCQ
jgi:hypothetical protein